MRQILVKNLYRIIFLNGIEKMSRTMWILATLLSIMIIATIYKQYANLPVPDHLNCKESMLEQMFSDRCTPRKQFKIVK